VLDPAIRTQYAYLEAWVSIVGNVALSAVKVAFGLLLNSISLLADAAHTAADVLTSVVVLVGFRLAKAPADEKHPFGHGRAEFLSSLVIAALLVYVGVEFGITSFRRLATGSAVRGNLLVAAVMVAGAIVKEWMTRFASYLGARANAQALIGDAWHHRTDAIASVLVAVAIVHPPTEHTGSMPSLASASRPHPLHRRLTCRCRGVFFDRRGGAGVCDLRDHEAVRLCDGVKGFHRWSCTIRRAEVGVAHIQVSHDLSLMESHRIASAVEEAVRSVFRGLCDACGTERRVARLIGELSRQVNHREVIQVRVFISCDIEGVSGVVSAAPQTSPEGKDYGRARELMTRRSTRHSRRSEGRCGARSWSTILTGP
jgi:divalent metal cation (Fe/Co/Zn/Cd) transporter